MKKAYIVPSLANAGPINVVMDLVLIMMLRSNKGTPAVIVENVHLSESLMRLSYTIANRK